jgi:hypothetical protein
MTALKRIRGALGMGVAWAAGWMVAGVAVGNTGLLLPTAAHASVLQVASPFVPPIAIAGFIGGVVFSLVLWVAARRRTFRDLSVPMFAACGALGGVALAFAPLALRTAGLESFPGGAWAILSGTAPAIATLTAASATLSLMAARRGQLSSSWQDSDRLIEP